MAFNPLNIFKFIYKVYDNTSPPVRTLIKISVLALEDKADETKNPWDNILVAILKMVTFVRKGPEE